MQYIPQNNAEILKIEPLNTDSIPKKGLKKIGGKQLLIAQIPSFFATIQPLEAYKIIMPPGVSGGLIQYKDGLLGTPLIKDGKIIGHAGLKSISGVVTPMLIFTAMSVVTGQYFLSQINKTLCKILNEIKKIEDILLLKEESNLFSHSAFLQRINRNYSFINSSNQLKNATITNIQRAINELTSSIYFYAQNTLFILNSMKQKEKFEELSTSEIKQNIEKFKISLKLRNMFIVMEFAFSQTFDTTTIENVQNNILNENLEVFAPLITEILNTNIKMQEKLSSNANTRKKQKKLKNFISELKSLKMGISEDYIIKEINSDITPGFDKLKEIDEKGTEFYIVGDEVYTIS